MNLPVIETPVFPRWVWMEEITYSHIPIATMITAYMLLAPAFELIGVLRKDPRWERLAKGFIWFSMILFSPGAALGTGIPVFIIGTYPEFWSRWSNLFFWPLIIQFGFFLAEVGFLFFGYYLSWDRWANRKGLHITMGVIAAMFGLMVQIVWDSLGAYMTTPGGVAFPGVGEPVGWSAAAFFNPSFPYLFIHRFFGNFSYVMLLTGGVFALRFLGTRRGLEEKTYFGWAANLCFAFGFVCFFAMPFIGWGYAQILQSDAPVAFRAIMGGHSSHVFNAKMILIMVMLLLGGTYLFVRYGRTNLRWGITFGIASLLIVLLPHPPLRWFGGNVWAWRAAVIAGVTGLIGICWLFRGRGNPQAAFWQWAMAAAGVAAFFAFCFGGFVRESSRSPQTVYGELVKPEVTAEEADRFLVYDTCLRCHFGGPQTPALFDDHAPDDWQGLVESYRTGKYANQFSQISNGDAARIVEYLNAFHSDRPVPAQYGPQGAGAVLVRETMHRMVQEKCLSCHKTPKAFDAFAAKPWDQLLREHLVRFGPRDQRPEKFRDAPGTLTLTQEQFANLKDYLESYHPMMLAGDFISIPGISAKWAIGSVALFHTAVASLAIGFAFVVTVLQIIGYRNRDMRFDYLAKRVQLFHVCMYNIGTINAIGLVFVLSGLYPQFWSQIFTHFFWPMIVEEFCFFLLATTLTLHYFFWDKLWGHKKLHIVLGALLTPVFFLQFFYINGMGGFMLTPEVAQPGTLSQWGGTADVLGWDSKVFFNPSFLMLTFHRTLANISYGALVAAAVCGVRLYFAKREKLREYYETGGRVAAMIGFVALLSLPIVGFFYAWVLKYEAVDAYWNLMKGSGDVVAGGIDWWWTKHVIVLLLIGMGLGFFHRSSRTGGKLGLPVYLVYMIAALYGIFYLSMGIQMTWRFSFAMLAAGGVGWWLGSVLVPEKTGSGRTVFVLLGVLSFLTVMLGGYVREASRPRFLTEAQASATTQAVTIEGAVAAASTQPGSGPARFSHYDAMYAPVERQIAPGGIDPVIKARPFPKVTQPRTPRDRTQQLISENCIACHTLAPLHDYRKTSHSRQEWETMLRRMKAYGMNLSEADLQRMLDYLAEGGAP